MAKHVLVVDDEPNILLSLQYILERAGYRVTTAADGATALHTAREERPDLVLLDIMLPDRDGYAVCQALRDDEAVTAPIVMLTARGREVDREKGLSLGADAYIVKPFAIAEVLAAVREHAGEA